MKQQLLNHIKDARRVGTPLVAISTPDPAATIEDITDAFNGETPVLVWDIVNAFTPRNDKGKEQIAKLVGESGDPTRYQPVEFARLVAGLPAKSIVFMHMAPRLLRDNPALIQAIWNLRDSFKENGRMLVMLGATIELPPELQGDVIAFDEPLPDEDAVKRIILQQFENANVIAPDEKHLQQGMEAVQGLPEFQIEQVTAMSLTRKGLDINGLWERKRRQIELTPGLKVFRDGAKFKDIGGVWAIKGFLGRVLVGEARPNAIVFVDEIEKMMAGSGSGGGSGDKWLNEKLCAGTAA